MVVLKCHGIRKKMSLLLNYLLLFGCFSFNLSFILNLYLHCIYIKIFLGFFEKGNASKTQ